MAQPSLARARAWEGGGGHQTRTRQAGSCQNTPHKHRVETLGLLCARLSSAGSIRSHPREERIRRSRRGKHHTCPPTFQGQLSALWYLERCLQSSSQTVCSPRSWSCLPSWTKPFVAPSSPLKTVTTALASRCVRDRLENARETRSRSTGKEDFPGSLTAKTSLSNAGG